MTYSNAVAKDPDSNESHILSRPFLGHYCFILHLSDTCPSVDK